YFLVSTGLIMNLETDGMFFGVNYLDHFHLHKSVTLSGLRFSVNRLHNTWLVKIKVIQLLIATEAVMIDALTVVAINHIQCLTGTRCRQNDTEAEATTHLFQHSYHGKERMPSRVGGMPVRV